MIIAVEFDGTIVENKFPEIGRERSLAIYYLKELQLRGHKIILWTLRSGNDLKAAIDYCRSEGLEFEAVNCGVTQNANASMNCKKVEADLYIDCKNIGGIPSWSEIFWCLHPDEYNHVKLRSSCRKKQNRFQKIFRRK